MDIHEQLQEWIEDNAKIEDTRGLSATDRGDQEIGRLEIVPCVGKVEATAVEEIPLEESGWLCRPEGDVEWAARRVWLHTMPDGRAFATYLVAYDPNAYIPTVCAWGKAADCAGPVIGVSLRAPRGGGAVNHGICRACAGMAWGGEAAASAVTIEEVVEEIVEEECPQCEGQGYRSVRRRAK